MSIPVIFIHRGDHFYLNYSLSQVKITNPGNPIYLITDTITNKYPFVNYIDINKYTKASSDFPKIYKHMSTNSYEMELFCFQRWYILKEFCADKGLSDLLYLDSDALIFCNIDSYFGKLKDHDFTTSKGLGPHCCYFSSAEKLNKFCDFVQKLYTDPDYTERFLTKHKYHLENNLPGGVCDMTAFNEYQKEPNVKAKELCVIDNNAIFDDNINDADGFVMKDKIKDLVLEDRFYYGTLKSNGQRIKFNLLHFQGSGKKRIAEFYLGTDLKDITRKLKRDKFLLENHFLYRIARRLNYKFY